MADSDSDPFQSADEDEAESRKAPQDMQPGGTEELSPSKLQDQSGASIQNESLVPSETNSKSKQEVGKNVLDLAQEEEPVEGERDIKQGEQMDEPVEEEPTDDAKEDLKQVASDEQNITKDNLDSESSAAESSVQKIETNGDDMTSKEDVTVTTANSKYNENVTSDKQNVPENDADCDPNVTKSSEDSVALEVDQEIATTCIKGDMLGTTVEDKHNEIENVDAVEIDDTKERTKPDSPEAPEAQMIQSDLDRLAVEGGERRNLEEKQETQPSGGWGAWGGWGSSLLSSATSKVSAMGHGLSSVIENVESSLGVPKPDELKDTTVKSTQGQDDNKEELQPKEDDLQDLKDKEGNSETSEQPAQSPSALGGWFSYGATAITSVVEKTVTGGLDALEIIGKKTMNVLQEGDPGLRKKRAYISLKSGQSINLSQSLREAKEAAEMASKLEEEEKENEKVHFGILFDNYQGLAHLEALEMLSNQSELKVHGTLTTLSGGKLCDIQTELTEIKDAFQVDDLESDEIDDEIDEHDFVNIITEHLFGVCVAATPNKLQKVQKSTREWLAECQKAQEDGEKKEVKELHIKAIETLAELTARSIEQFHKSAELMLLHQDKDHDRSHIQRATSLSKLTSALCAELSNLASKFCERLNTVAIETQDASETINPVITNIYLEASNSASYIQDAFQLLLPVLQALAVENSMEELQPDAATAS